MMASVNTKPMTYSQLARNIYRSLADLEDRRNAPPKPQPWWDTPQYKTWNEGANQRELQRKNRRK
jgi:hypothetical protein